MTAVNAGAFLQELHQRILSGTFSSKDFRSGSREQLQFRNYHESYIARMQARAKLKPGTDGAISGVHFKELEKYGRLYLIPHFGEVQLKDIRKSDVKSFLEGLVSAKSGEPASDTIKKKALDCLRHVLLYAVEEEDIPPLPFTFPKVKKEYRELSTVDDIEQEEILVQVPPASRPILQFAVHAPHRTNELRGLKCGDINFTEGTYRLAGACDERDNYKRSLKIRKTTGAVIPFPSEEVPLIFREAMGSRIFQPDEFVFLNPNSGKPWTHRALDGVFRRAARKAGHPHVTLEMFGRHSWITKRLNEGWSFTSISVFTLNSVTVLEKRYANITKATRLAVLESVRRRSNER